MTVLANIYAIDERATDGADSDLWRSGMVECLITLSRDLGIMVTAEGVETIEQLRNLQDLGCDSAQGYLLGMPMQAGKVMGFLDDLSAGIHDALLGGAPSPNAPRPA